MGARGGTPLQIRTLLASYSQTIVNREVFERGYN
jgi:hypothetical protein